jgi:hypothetical protein
LDSGWEYSNKWRTGAPKFGSDRVEYANFSAIVGSRKEFGESRLAEDWNFRTVPQVWWAQ